MRRTVHSVSLLSTASTPIHDFSRPLQERKEARKHCGSIFSLRLSYANEHLDSSDNDNEEG